MIECRVAELESAARALIRGVDGLGGERAPRFLLDRGPGALLRLFDGQGRLLREDPRPGELLGALEVAIELALPDLFRDRCVFHAAVLVRGRALAVAGESHAGKSTLAAALVSEGLDYATDDAAIVEADGSITPYPRRIQLREGARALLEPLGPRLFPLSYVMAERPPCEYVVAAPEATVAGPTRAGVLAFLEGRGTALRVRTISAAEATARLLTHAVGTHDAPEHLRRAAKLVEGTTSRLVVEGGAPRELARHLAGVLGGG